MRSITKVDMAECNIWLETDKTTSTTYILLYHQQSLYDFLVGRRRLTDFPFSLFLPPHHLEKYVSYPLCFIKQRCDHGTKINADKFDNF